MNAVCKTYMHLVPADQKSVQILEVGEVSDMFVPNPEDLLVNLEQSRTLIEELLSKLPESQAGTVQTQSALGPALQAAYKLMVRLLSVFIYCLFFYIFSLCISPFSSLFFFFFYKFCLPFMLL